jgi:aspartate racemase
MPVPSPRQSVHRFDDAREAMHAIGSYISWLQLQAISCRSNGAVVKDQDYPEDAFCLMPKRPYRRPLALIGGMGPLAGARAFIQACEKFGESRRITLYQACSVPDRTSIILAGRRNPSHSSDLEMATHLANAVCRALDLFPETTEWTDCILVCNSAHYFYEPLARILARFPAYRMNLISLTASAIRRVCSEAIESPVLLLCTEGARVGRIFSRAAAAAGVNFEEPSAEAELLLMRAIYHGIKSMDDERAVRFGTQFFETILREKGPYDSLLAGCTELPMMIELLRARGTPDVKAFLSHAAIIDPMNAALDAADQTEDRRCWLEQSPAIYQSKATSIQTPQKPRRRPDGHEQEDRSL